jgi:Tfp pilus assembly protein, ATPase PilM
MKTGTKTALGIEISETLINMALLEKGKDGVQLVRAASTPVPAGAIKNGSIEDAEILSKAIKELKARNKIRARQVAVSLLARPVVAQPLKSVRGGCVENRRYTLPLCLSGRWRRRLCMYHMVRRRNTTIESYRGYESKV